MHVSGFYVFHFSMFFSFFEIPLSSQECSTTHLHNIATLTYYTICRKGCIFILSCVLQKHRTYFFKIKNEPVKAHFCDGKCNIIIKICRLAYIFQDTAAFLIPICGNIKVKLICIPIPVGNVFINLSDFICHLNKIFFCSRRPDELCRFRQDRILYIDHFKPPFFEGFKNMLFLSSVPPIRFPFPSRITSNISAF